MDGAFYRSGEICRMAVLGLERVEKRSHSFEKIWRWKGGCFLAFWNFSIVSL
jgi:hypothetical protein